MAMRSPPSGSQPPCPALAMLAGDVREIVRDACPACQGTGSTCIMIQLRELAAPDGSGRMNCPPPT